MPSMSEEGPHLTLSLPESLERNFLHRLHTALFNAGYKEMGASFGVPDSPVAVAFFRNAVIRAGITSIEHCHDPASRNTIVRVWPPPTSL